MLVVAYKSEWKLLSHVCFFATPWNSPGQKTGVGSCSLLQGIFPAQESNLDLPHCRRILYQLSHQGNPRILEWVACSSPEHIFLTQELNWGLWHCRQILYELSYQGIPSPMKFNLILLLCFLFPFNPLYFNFLNVNGLYF